MKIELIPQRLRATFKRWNRLQGQKPLQCPLCGGKIQARFVDPKGKRKWFSCEQCGKHEGLVE